MDKFLLGLDVNKTTTHTPGTFLSIFAVCKIAVFGNSPIQVSMPMPLSLPGRFFGVVPSVPITIGMITIFMSHRFFSPRARSCYFSISSISSNY